MHAGYVGVGELASDIRVAEATRSHQGLRVEMFVGATLSLKP